MNRNVLFVSENTPGKDAPSAYYRCTLPSRALKGRGWNTATSHFLLQRDDGRLTGWDPQGPVYRTPHFIVCRHLSGPDEKPILSADMFRKARDNGQFVFMDLDDDYWNIPDWNPAKGTFTPEVMELWEQDMDACDGILVTTRGLAESVYEHTKTPVYICRNGIDGKHFRPHRADEHAPIRLGWLSLTHWRARDLLTIKEAIYDTLAEKIGEVEFWHIGYKSDNPPIGAILPQLPVVTKSLDWVPMEYLGVTLDEIDVAIVPQLPNRFAESRSTTTGMILAAMGIPFAATPTGPYRDLWRIGVGYPAEDYETWCQAIRILTEEPYREVRREMRTAGLQAANSLLSINATVKDWEDVFNSVSA